jgi:hypothetical protein
VSPNRRILIGVLALYVLGLGWGYFRLPWAAIRSLRNFRSLAAAPAVSFSDKLDVSPAQRWYLERSLTESPVPVVPRVEAEVRWNALIVARVHSGYYVSSKGAEWRKDLYLCAFGAWIPIYTFHHSVL